MDTARMVRELDAEIARLTSARNLLAGSSNTHAKAGVNAFLAENLSSYFGKKTMTQLFARHENN